MDAKTLERFWSKVDVRDPNECWEWQAAKNPTGHGAFGVGGNKVWVASRFSAALAFGFDAVEKAEAVCHRCDNPPCVNPRHLFLGTRADNLKDMWDKGRGVVVVGNLVHGRGEAHTSNKLTESEVMEIRHAVAAGQSKRALGKKYGVSESNIAAVSSGRSWTHVGGPITPPKRPAS